jgi:hypothetical protein
MPSNLFGLPVHILVVHAVVVLLPSPESRRSSVRRSRPRSAPG